ncbi:Dyp-type peroxidase [Pseudosporangium ferrugineum]|uniref:Dye decolorizing peroxidase n=1 Tax=Pseudosporangium ferrugineum TaxID=439699 RepID=A0A2T0RI42_9ACTN|nr:Dyp-type peroxidase [Pseudosporangium ferrugineum]PRY20797.1 dye decolorizing peroxidase [Pseudosporangium ferrugineum]
MTTRRRLLAGGAVAGAGAVAAAVVAGGPDRAVPAAATPPDDTGTATVPFHGPRQSGITDEPPAHAAFVAFTLAAGTDRRALGRMLRLLSDDAARLTRGVPALGDTDATLAVLPARLTVTFGFGPGLYTSAGLPAPVADLPRFAIDRLERRWSGGDLLLQICADDPLTVAHTQRMLIKDARPFAAVRWVQQGFRRSPGVQAPGHTQRNVLGQLDGTANPRGAELEGAVWNADGSSTLVVRRIRAEIEKWDLLAVADKESATGRRLATGAPLSGQDEHDEPDFAALDPSGLPAMPDFSHVTRAHVTDPALKILRRPYNYDGVPDAGGRPDAGLIFAAYQRDLVRQFLPIQRRLAEKDLLNEWITPIGSAVFAVPPGCAEGGWIGEQVLA